MSLKQLHRLHRLRPLLSSHGDTCQWLPPLPFCNFHRALTFGLHHADTAYTACTCLPTLKTHILLHYLPPLWCRTSVPADPMLSPSPTAMMLLPSAAVYAVSAGWHNCFIQSRLSGVPSCTVCQVCLCPGHVDIAYKTYRVCQ